jgi:hypothetical protein
MEYTVYVALYFKETMKEQAPEECRKFLLELNEKKDGIVAQANANIAERLGTTEEVATTLVLVVLSEYGKFLNVFDKTEEK